MQTSEVKRIASRSNKPQYTSSNQSRQTKRPPPVRTTQSTVHDPDIGAMMADLVRHSNVVVNLPGKKRGVQTGRITKQRNIPTKTNRQKGPSALELIQSQMNDVASTLAQVAAIVAQAPQQSSAKIAQPEDASSAENMSGQPTIHVDDISVSAPLVGDKECSSGLSSGGNISGQSIKANGSQGQSTVSEHEIESLRVKNELLASEKADFVNRLIGSEAHVAKLESRLNDERSAHKAQVEEIESKLRRFEANMAASNKLRDQLRIDYDSLYERHGELNARYDGVVFTCAGQETEIASLRGQIAILSGETGMLCHTVLILWPSLFCVP